MTASAPLAIAFAKRCADRRERTDRIEAFIMPSVHTDCGLAYDRHTV